MPGTIWKKEDASNSQIINSHFYGCKNLFYYKFNSDINTLLNDADTFKKGIRNNKILRPGKFDKNLKYKNTRF